MKIRLMHPVVGEIAFPLEPGGSLVVGRLGSMTDVEISWDPRISRRHCRLWEKDGRVWFQDLASRNGSWIGTDRITGVVRLDPGSSVLIGETVLLLPDPSSPEDRSLEETHERALSAEEIEELEAASASAANLTMALRPEFEPTGPSAPSVEVVPPPPAPAPPGPPAPAASRGIRETADLPLLDPSSEETGEGESPEVPSVDRETRELGRVVRGAPRFVSSTRIRVRARGREELRELWTRDISKGGLFVETRVPPPSGTRLDVALETPNGSIELSGTVVHVLTFEMAASFGGQPGVGIQFVNLDPQTRSAIQSYVEGLAEHLEGRPDARSQLSAAASDEALKRAARFLEDSEQADFYAALGITANAGASQLEKAMNQLHEELHSAAERMRPPQSARIEAALNVLGRAKRILTKEAGRLEYDFRNGHVRALERIRNAQAGGRPDLSALRQAWNRVFPDRVDRAALLTRKAFAARQRQDLAGAIDAGRNALELNPFFEELRQTVDVWEKTADRSS